MSKSKKVAKKKPAPKKAAPKKVAKKSPAKKSPAKKTAVKKAVKKAAPKKKARKPNAAFMAPLATTAVLADVVGTKPLPRTEIIRSIWVYIKKNKLQDSTNKRMINADAKLKPLFGGKSQVSMFELAGIVNKNVKKS
ncbi:MAG: SWIB/MDM2 domain-containing protein [Bacteroidota bacterium]|nr:SWIB/MDM2 domain-containing protein [Bacteroidota bacterium]MDP4218172.1 SWIB/MDM2 domain-containing protein [Bacteroidota bacterium]MDP4246593.1 SWIB/MDM2 domain-containing protein [Bacteroidota bacterium]MDP4253261.1 SWIB/MDM2 domain-containing protein [Bacteroidota bacterium]MDP4259904.1 SWIB/MDM2 domain-containing protein [Bacteroidota bacterium]